MQEQMSYSKTTWVAIALGALVVIGAGCAGSVTKETIGDTAGGEAVIEEQDGSADDTMEENIPMTEDGGQEDEGGSMTEGEGTAVGAGVVREIGMIARSWEFVPSEIHMALGETVRLVITNEDVDHGIMIPGLGVNEKIPAGETVTVEFTADTAGEHSFFCNVFCGSGHRDMRGTVIVE